MPGNNTAELKVGANGSIHVAPVATTAPADEVAAYGSGWIDLGLMSEDGVKLRDEKTEQAFRSWQLFYPARKQITERRFTSAFVMQQWNKNNIPLAFGGGTVSTVSTGHYKYQPPAPQTRDERALGIDWLDGSYHYRLLIPKGQVGEPVESDVNKGNLALLPITFEVIGGETGDPWYLLTDDPAFL